MHLILAVDRVFPVTVTELEAFGDHKPPPSEVI